MIEEKITSKKQLDSDLDDSLRPSKFDDFIGQEKVKNNIKVFVNSAKIRNTTLDHTILYGPPGLGKTTLAKIISNEMGKAIKITSAPTIEKQGDLMAVLTSLEAGDILLLMKYID